MLIRDIMIKEVVTVDKSFNVKQCIDILFKRHIGSVMVVDAQNKISGILTERDIIRIISQDTPLSTPVSDVMTTNVKTISLDATFAEARELMRMYRIRHIPVVDDEGKLAGLISLRHLIDEFFEIIPSTRSQF